MIDDTKESSLQSDVTVANQLARKADWALEDGDLEEAIVLFKEALALDPSYKYARFGLAQAYVEQEKPAKALPLLRSLVDEFPDELEMHNELGLALMEANEHDDAIDVFQGILAKEDHYPAPYANLGAIWEERGELDKAIEAYETYLEWSDDAEECDEIEYRLKRIQRKRKRQASSQTSSQTSSTPGADDHEGA